MSLDVVITSPRTCSGLACAGVITRYSACVTVSVCAD